MTDIEIAAELIKQFEGFVATPYLCTGGKWTIGYGSTRDIRGIPVTPTTQAVTKTQATSMLMRDISVAVEDVRKHVKVYLGANQRAALISFTYNLGGRNLGISTLLKKLNVRDYKGASAEFDKWIYSGGKITKGLINRRAKEKDFFLKDML